MQLGLNAQNVLQQYGFAFSVAASPAFTRYLQSVGVELEPLDEVMLKADDSLDAILDAADLVLKQAELEQPVLVLVPGNPLFLNSLSRFLVSEGRARGLVVETLSGVSQLDVLINELGVDVAARGIQIFDASSLLAAETALNTLIPTVLFRLSGLTGGGNSLAALKALLKSSYSDDHLVTLFNSGTSSTGPSHATCQLLAMEDFDEHIDSSSSLFIGPSSS